MTHELWKALYEELGKLKSDGALALGGHYLNLIAYTIGNSAGGEKGERATTEKVLRSVLKELREKNRR